MDNPTFFFSPTKHNSATAVSAEFLLIAFFKNRTAAESATSSGGVRR